MDAFCDDIDVTMEWPVVLDGGQGSKVVDIALEGDMVVDLIDGFVVAKTTLGDYASRCLGVDGGAQDARGATGGRR